MLKGENMFFVHTFSLIEKYRSVDEIRALWTTYNRYNLESKTGFQINEYVNQGVRLCIRYLCPERKHYEQYEAEVEIIVTPYKLINNERALGYLREIREYKEALYRFYEIINKIQAETGVDLKNAKIRRIDVTRDVITPSSGYTKEIIRTIKIQRLPYGYHAMDSEIATRNQWNPENAYFYWNKNQNVSVKVYDKVQNLQDYKNEEWKELKGKGILRFEVTLEKKSLKKIGDDNTDLVQLIEMVLECAEQIYDEHVVLPLDTGVMLSEDVLCKYVDRKISQRRKKEKMRECILKCQKEKRNAGILDDSFMGTEKRTEKVWEYFQKLEVSPIPLKAECPYIPSVSQLLYGENEESKKIQKFAVKHTRRKEYWKNEQL